MRWLLSSCCRKVSAQAVVVVVSAHAHKHIYMLYPAPIKLSIIHENPLNRERSFRRHAYASSPSIRGEIKELRG